MINKSNNVRSLKRSLIVFLLSLVVTLICIVTLFSIPASATMTERVTTTAPETTVQEPTTTQPVVTTVPYETAETDTASDDKGLLSLLDVNDSNDTLDLVLLITILSLAPSILILMTSFTRIIIVLSLLRNAMGVQQTPPNQVLIGLALFLSLFVMAPVITQINDVAYKPYKAGEMTTIEASKAAAVPLKEFMLKQTGNESLQLFLDISGEKMPTENISENLGLEVVAPAFIISELKKAFTIGFLLFIPFLIIDIVVSSTLMSMGMIMLPPAMISLPFKILLFILVDGWQLLVGALVKGFNM